MKIKITSIYVNDQEKALRFYTEVMGFAKKMDVKQGPFRWLTVVADEDPDGIELQLALNDNPAAAAYQKATFEQNQPALRLNSSDVQKDYDRMKPLGAEFTMPPTKTKGSTITMFKDTCGNIIQISQFDRWQG